MTTFVDSGQLQFRGAAVSEPKKKLKQIRQSLEQSAETRMRAIQERISTTETLLKTLEIEIRFGRLDRARDHLNKLRSIIKGLIAHIGKPAHVSDKQLKQQFRKQLAQIEQGLSSLDFQINHHRGGRTS